MPGHARERSPGRWELRVYVGRDPLTSRKMYATKTISATGPRDADRALAAYVTELSETGTVTSQGSFGELVEQWYRHRAPDMTPAGRRETRRIIDANLKGSPLWTAKLAAVAGRGGTQVLDEFYAALRDRGGRCRRRPPCPTAPCPHGGGEPLAASTVHRVHGIIHAALEQAVTWDLCRRNPATNASPGDIDVTEVRPPDPDLVIRMFELARPEFGRFVALAAATGARRGELLALRWDDIDTFNNVINFRYVISLGPDGPERVRKGRGKGNRKGRGRSVPVDPAVGALLSAQFEESAARAAKLGIVLQPGDASYVFPAFGRDGSKAVDDYGFDPWRPDSTSRQFAALRAAAGLTGVRLHDLRHFVVSRLLAAGVDLRTVQELVGHAPGSPTTMRVYAHASDPNKVAAAAVMAKLLELGPAEVP